MVFRVEMMVQSLSRKTTCQIGKKIALTKIEFGGIKLNVFPKN